jgi:hypothetical protein
VFWRCERADRDTHGGDAPGGESVVKYRITSPLNRRYFGWISPRLRFLVRLEAEDGGTTELVNLQETAQPDRLFEIPPGFAKFDPKHLIERIKKSDAWVEPMK